MPRVNIFIMKEVADEREAQDVVDNIKLLADKEVKKEGTIISATYQKEI